jgi:hypothetical protein
MPDVLGYLQDVLSGKIASGGVLGQNNYDPRVSLAQNALNPAALQQAMDIGLGVSGGGLSTVGQPKFTLHRLGDAGDGMWNVKAPNGNDLGQIARFLETDPSGKVTTVYSHSLQTDAPYFNTVQEAGTDLRRAFAEMLRNRKGLLD